MNYVEKFRAQILMKCPAKGAKVEGLNEFKFQKA